MRRPWFPLYVDDFTGDELVRTADNRTVGAYMFLLCHQWREGSLPVDERSLAIIARENLRTFKRIWNELRKKFELRDGRFINTRLDDEKEKALRRSKLGGDAARMREPGIQRFLYAASAIAYTHGHSGSPVPLIKIGWSRNPGKRVGHLKHDDLDLFQIVLLGEVSASLELERRAHIDLASHIQANEWFHDRPEVRKWLSDHGITAGLTGGRTAKPALVLPGIPPEQSQSQLQEATTSEPTVPAKPQEISPNGTVAGMIRRYCYPPDGKEPEGHDIARDIRWWNVRVARYRDSAGRLEMALKGAPLVVEKLRGVKWSPAKMFSKQGEWADLFERSVTAAGKDRKQKGPLPIGKILHDAQQRGAPA